MNVTPGVTTLPMTHPLTEARKRADLTQQGLADMIRKDRLTILRIENAQTQPSPETVAKIITALREKNVELSPDDFLGTFRAAASPKPDPTPTPEVVQ